MPLKVFGKKPLGKRLEIIKESPQYINGVFKNISETPVMAKDASYLTMIKSFFIPAEDTLPAYAIPHIKTDLKNFRPQMPSLIWFGHSSYLLRIAGKNVLVDPVLSGSASPFSFMVKAFKGSNEYTPGDFPEIDLLLLTHDHYDHLDYKTIVALKPKVKKIVCSLGLGSHLEYWGIDNSIVTEMDWWDKHIFENIEITAAPARHFTGRGIARAKTLWSSFIIKANEHNLYLGGDSGYDSHFKMIGEKYGPFDIALLESGQYNTMWPHIHMMPEETVQASLDLKAKVLMPVHWGKYKLAMHAWNEPVKRVLKKAEELNVKVIAPLIGEPYTIGDNYINKNWWDF